MIGLQTRLDCLIVRMTGLQNRLPDSEDDGISK